MVVMLGEDADQDDRDRDGDEERSRPRKAAVFRHYQPDAAQISCFSLAASAPAADLKSPPFSRNA